MTYVERTLGRGEEFLYAARFHWSYTLAAFFWLTSLGVILIGIWLFISMMIRMWTTEIAVTSERVVYKTGLIARKTKEVSLHTIEEVNLTQGIVGRLLGFGSLRVQGTGVGVIDLPAVDRPLELRRQITSARDGPSRA